MKFIIYFLFVLINLLFQVSTLDITDTYVENVCFCIPIGQCRQDGNGESSTLNYEASTDYNERSSLEPSDGVIDLRIMNFYTGERNTDNGNVNNPNIFPVSTGTKIFVSSKQSCDTGLELCCPKEGYKCGTKYPPVTNAPSKSDLDQTDYGAHPWHVAVLTEFNEFLAAGVLIDHRHVLTAAHKIFRSSNMKCRAGDWNIGTLDEPYLPQELSVDDINVIIHPNFTDPRTVTNDIAILRTNDPGFLLGSFPIVAPVCLPNQQLYNQRCWTAGWGIPQFESENYQTVLQEVHLPLINNTECQNALRKTRLGSNFILDSYSFICAGMEDGKDACTGDGGAGLVCSVNNQFFLVGLVAWGIGCGSASVPGVYVNVQSFIPWIQSIIQKLEGIDIRTKSVITSNEGNGILAFQSGTGKINGNSVVNSKNLKGNDAPKVGNGSQKTTKTYDIRNYDWTFTFRHITTTKSSGKKVGKGLNKNKKTTKRFKRSTSTQSTKTT